MTGVRSVVPRADGGLLLVLAVLGLALIASWPGRPELANGSWSVVAPLRASLLVAWGWAIGTDAGTRGGATAGRLRTSLARLALAGAVTAPVEALAHAASVPNVPFAWGAVIAPIAAIAGCGFAWAVTAWLNRAGAAWTAVLILPAAAAAAVTIDVTAGTALFTPWLLPGSPSVAAAIALGALASLWIVVAVRNGGTT